MNTLAAGIRVTRLVSTAIGISLALAMTIGVVLIALAALLES